MDENELASDQIEEYSRPRNQSRKYNEFAKVEIQDLIITRRHFPDQVLLNQRKKNGSTENPTEGLKFKTFILSARDF